MLCELSPCDESDDVLTLRYTSKVGDCRGITINDSYRSAIFRAFSAFDAVGVLVKIPRLRLTSQIGMSIAYR